MGPELLNTHSRRLTETARRAPYLQPQIQTLGSSAGLKCFCFDGKPCFKC